MKEAYAHSVSRILCGFPSEKLSCAFVSLFFFLYWLAGLFLDNWQEAFVHSDTGKSRAQSVIQVNVIFVEQKS